MESVENIVKQARADIAQCDDVQRLDEIRVRYLGKKGEVTALLKTLGSIEPEQRREFGQAINAAKSELMDLIGLKKSGLEAARLEKKLITERIDVTLP